METHSLDIYKNALFYIASLERSYEGWKPGNVDIAIINSFKFRKIL